MPYGEAVAHIAVLARRATYRTSDRSVLPEFLVSGCRRPRVVGYLKKGRRAVPKAVENVLDQRLRAARDVWGVRRVGVDQFLRLRRIRRRSLFVRHI